MSVVGTAAAIAELEARIVVLEGHRNQWRREAGRMRDAVQHVVDAWLADDPNEDAAERMDDACEWAADVLTTTDVGDVGRLRAALERVVEIRHECEDAGDGLIGCAEVAEAALRGTP